MGYHSDLSGEITFNPPIPWGELQDSEFISPGGNAEWRRLVWLRMVEETVETSEGTLTRKQAVAIRPSDAGELRAGPLVSQLQEIVTKHGEGRTFDGHILVLGECSPDIWRVQVEDGKAVEVRPRIVWPDGVEVNFNDHI
ncbi:DUF6205 family protein [Streptosporangium amethystogenes subsp. fukuiense]|uniref:DUF6205 family protein n=1 Tax=Streptosporangium amethystogenes subsp. fukuiense TaxID=698418 RepID=A0ABW2T530_9ACTN